jgi:hypothetical protein
MKAVTIHALAILVLVLASIGFAHAQSTSGCPQSASVKCPTVLNPGSDECPGSGPGTAKGHAMSASCAIACAKADKAKKVAAKKSNSLPYWCKPCDLLGCGPNF